MFLSLYLSLDLFCLKGWKNGRFEGCFTSVPPPSLMCTMGTLKKVFTYGCYNFTPILFLVYNVNYRLFILVILMWKCSLLLGNAQCFEGGYLDASRTCEKIFVHFMWDYAPVVGFDIKKVKSLNDLISVDEVLGGETTKRNLSERSVLLLAPLQVQHFLHESA